MNKDRITGLLFLFFCALLWTWLIPCYVKGEEQSIFPKLVTLFIAIPSLLLCLRKGGHAPAEPSSCPSGIFRSSGLHLLLLAAGYALYLIAAARIGFFVSSLAAGMSALLFFRERSPLIILGVPLSLLAVIYFVIVYLLKYPMPAGILF